MKETYRTILSTFERLASSYGFSSGMEEVNRRELAPIVNEWEGRLLDVGAGAGAFIEKYLDPSKHEVHAVDFSFKMLEETRKRLGGEAGRSVFLVRSLAQSLPYQRDSFDAAVSVNTLHNMPGLEDVRQALAEMARVVRPRGTILAEFRNWDNPQRRRISRLYDSSDLPQKAYTAEQIEKEFTQLGFEIRRWIGLWGDHIPEGAVDGAVERLKRSFDGKNESRAPRFAVLAEKSPGFKTILMGAAGHPIAY
jgi:ubiquinone/menaquinone biosynthesis C-methylase UbiE